MGPVASDPASVALIQSAKRTLRAELLTARIRASPQTGPRITPALLAVPEVAAAATLAGYSPLRGEPDVGPALLELTARGVRVLLPVVLPDRDLDFVVNGSVVGLAAADVVLVPALAADRSGHRLGRGGGSYDRALARVRPGALVIAVVHAEELLAEVPTEPHDARVNAVLAGAELIRL